MKKILLFLFITTITYSFNVKITHIEDLESPIYIAVFDSEEGFPYEGEKGAFVWMGSSEEAKSGVDTKLLDGTYSVLAFQDLDGNKQLTKWFFGAPKEPFGISTGDTKPRREPNFYKTCLELEKSDTVHIRLWQP